MAGVLPGQTLRSSARDKIRSLPPLKASPSGPQALQVAPVVKNLPANVGDIRDAGSIPGSGRSLGGGPGNPLQCSCLENPMDRGAWQVTAHGSQRARHDWSDIAQAHVVLTLLYISLPARSSEAAPCSKTCDYNTLKKQKRAVDSHQRRSGTVSKWVYTVSQLSELPRFRTCRKRIADHHLHLLAHYSYKSSLTLINHGYGS